MRRTRRGMTLTELLTVVAVIAILTSMISPMVVQARKSAQGRACMHNIQNIYVALSQIANNNYGRLPACFDLDGEDIKGTVYKVIVDGQVVKVKENDETSWWYHKVARVLYPDYLRKKTEERTVTLQDGTKKTVEVTTVTDYIQGNDFQPDQCVLRCPVSLDPCPHTRAHHVPNPNNTVIDRVFDDNYGYNNYGFRYKNHENQHAIPDPATLMWGRSGTSSYYHEKTWTGGTGWGAIKGWRVDDQPGGDTDEKTHLGRFTDFPEASRTIVLMDYVKADIAPRLQNDGLWGFRFRHNGTANVLFADGHVLVYSREAFLSDLGIVDPTTGREKIHWYVVKP